MKRILVFVGLKIAEVGGGLFVLFWLLRISYATQRTWGMIFPNESFWSAAGLFGALAGLCWGFGVLMLLLLIVFGTIMFVKWNWRKAGELSTRKEGKK